jgi:hypothetical protein
MGDDGRYSPWAPPEPADRIGRPLPPPAPPAGSTGHPSPTQRRRRRVWPVVVAALLAMALLAAGTAGVLTRDDGSSAPSGWAPEVAGLVPFVERAKGASFTHPVRVVVLDEQAFRERVTQDEEDLTDQDRADLDQTEAELRALGLAGGEGSLFDQVNTMTGGGVAAFYDPDAQEIVIPATTDAPLAQQQTLVHELTHALQDQLGQLDEPEDSDASSAFDALVEGDAEHVATEWADTLSDRQRAQLDEQSRAQGDTATDELDSVNPVLLAMFAAPYSLGEAMAAALDDAGRLDDAFTDPPASFADVQDPARWLDPVDRVQVDDPALTDGETEQGEPDTFGAQALYLMLATAMEPGEALVVADGWGGDRMRSFESSDGADCMRVAMTGVDGDTTDSIEGAVRTWVADRPDASATASRAGDVVTFEACDPGTSGSEPLSDAVAGLPGIRASLVPQFQQAGLSFTDAVCASTELVRLLQPELFLQETLSSAEEANLQVAIEAAYSTCGG